MTKKYYRYNDEKGQVEWVGEGDFFEPVTDELALKADKTELFSGNYNDLTNKPSIPSQTDVDMGVTAYGWGDHASEGYAKTKADVGLGNVDNTSDVNKPISTATQAALDTKVNTDDSRLTNSREWTASTVSQTEAEAGTSTTRRAWTAQRVRQAIVAWFNGVSGTIGRTILGRSTAAQVRGDLGLGSAATRDVGTSSGNVMEVGAFGLGSRGVLNSNLENKSYIAYYNPDNLPTDYPAGEYGYGAVLSLAHGYSGTNMDMVFTHTSNSKIIYRNSRNAPWQEIYHTGNILKTTGNNDNYPMSQKAVTDELNDKVDKSGGLLEGGFIGPEAVDDGVKSSGGYKPDPTTSNFRKITNGGGFTFIAPDVPGSYNMTVEMVNNSSAGVVTFSGFVQNYPRGDLLTTGAGHAFKIHISKTSLGTTAFVEALQ